MPKAIASTAAACPRCGAKTTGPFCSECGAAVKGASCIQCNAELSPGARFCHRCGTPANASEAVPARQSRSPDPLPWAVAAIALLALIALIVGTRFGAGRQNPQDLAPVATGMPRAPDISQMTPRQITDILFERVMRLHEAGLTDSVKFTAQTMAIPAFDLHDSLDADLRYDLGHIAEVSGILDLAKAQADTILQENPQHLLGLALAARVARIQGNTSAARSFDSRLLAAEKSELAQNREEYLRHKNDIDSALAVARRGTQ